MEVPLPDDYDGAAISVAGTMDHDYGEADVNLDDADHARDIVVPDDAESVGVNANHADAVAEYLGVSLPSDDEEDDAEAEDDKEPASYADLIDQGVCPWCDDYEGDGVPQHASAAHPDEWADYTED